MTALSIALLYGIGGSIAFGLVLAREQSVGGFGRTPSAFLAALLWPFLLPTLLPNSRTGTRVETAAARLRADAWAVVASLPDVEPKLLDRFVARLRTEEVRLAEMEAALTHAAPSVRDRLSKLAESVREEIDRGVALLDELGAQLTLLRFAGKPDSRVERIHIEDLLAQIEAVVEISGESSSIVVAPARSPTPEASRREMPSPHAPPFGRGR